MMWEKKKMMAMVTTMHIIIVPVIKKITRMAMHMQVRLLMMMMTRTIVEIKERIMQVMIVRLVEQH